MLTLVFLVGLQSSAPRPLHSRTRADAEQPYLAEEEAMIGLCNGSPGFRLDLVPIASTDISLAKASHMVKPATEGEES